MTLQLMKIQEGMGEGNVLYHTISECTPAFHLSFCLIYSGVHDEKNHYEFYDFSKSKRLLIHLKITLF